MPTLLQNRIPYEKQDVVAIDDKGVKLGMTNGRPWNVNGSDGDAGDVRNYLLEVPRGNETIIGLQVFGVGGAGFE